MKRFMREQLRLLDRWGVTVEEMRHGHGSHWVAYCRGPQGQRFTAILTTSQGDVRGLRNFERDIKKQLTGL